MSENEKIELLLEAMELEDGDLSCDMQLEDIEEWDSLSKLALIVAVKKATGQILGAEELNKFETVKDILNWIQ